MSEAYGQYSVLAGFQVYHIYPLRAAGVYKVPYPPPLRIPGVGSLSSLLGQNIKLWREEGNIMSVGKNITWKKGKGKQYHLPYIIKAVK